MFQNHLPGRFDPTRRAESYASLNSLADHPFLRVSFTLVRHPSQIDEEPVWTPVNLFDVEVLRLKPGLMAVSRSTTVM